MAQEKNVTCNPKRQRSFPPKNSLNQGLQVIKTGIICANVCKKSLEVRSRQSETENFSFCRPMAAFRILLLLTSLMLGPQRSVSSRAVDLRPGIVRPTTRALVLRMKWFLGTEGPTSFSKADILGFHNGTHPQIKVVEVGVSTVASDKRSYRWSKVLSCEAGEIQGEDGVVGTLMLGCRPPSQM